MSCVETRANSKQATVERPLHVQIGRKDRPWLVGRGHVSVMQLRRGGVSGCKWVINWRADAAWRLGRNTPVD